MKKTDQKEKRKGRDKGLPAAGVRANSEGKPLHEGKDERNRGGQIAPRKEVRKDGSGSVWKYVAVAAQFLRESRTELRKVKWPTRKELLASTAAVIVLVLVVSLYLGLIDFGLIKIIRSIVG
ncbi:MAG: preprotein translocase subunit SecE [Desulfobacteraceae bacterium]|nr:MAG: preprotein translocase subunit SecE [Desulfobacteraceae bacterium]